MKILGKTVLAFFVAICMVSPILSQTASATDNVLGLCAAMPEEKAISVNAEFIAGEEDEFSNEPNRNLDTSAYITANGTRVKSITIYPLGINLDTGETITAPNVYKRVIFASSGQGEGLYFTKEQTASLTKQMRNYLSSLGGNYALYGWRISGTVTFTQNKLKYLTYHGETISYKTAEKRVDLSGSSATLSFTMDLPYPTGVDLDNDYYYARITGASYFETSTGGSSDALFLIAGGFNSK